MGLFQNLPHDIALQCLIRVPYKQFHSFKSVCKAWKNDIELSELLRLRKSTGKAQLLVVLNLARVNPNRNIKCSDTLVYRPVVLEPETGCWSEMPELPEYPYELPMFCEMVALGSVLVVMGGYAPRFTDCLDSVFIFDFISSTWRRGKPIPGGPRAFFGCASDGDRTVIIAGGHDLQMNALKSTWAYDVAKDEWNPLPDMAKERDECSCLYQNDKFHVIGGYPTNMQGYDYEDVEIYDTSAREWSQSDDMPFYTTISMNNICMGSRDDKIYKCHGNGVVVLEGDTWKFVAELPVDVAYSPYLTLYPGHVLVIGASKSGEPNHAYKMDMNECVWTKVEVPIAYSGHVQSVCSLII
ncbi:F-box/kelch-repeat protein At1g15670-like [Rutidosis leptorrhynchoides]|uniref:F-box/kelch-repeat protein At1g15670-like n=1 Tax=Rutidosis leptorrhynchoides TaxID=125765 RepID=UPI003A997B36